MLDLKPFTKQGKPRKKSGRPPIPLWERLEAKFVPEPNSGCWLWIGWMKGNSGYGHFGFKEGGRTRGTQAHRAVYQALVGKIKDDLQLDHKCRVRCCVNPDHLEPVTARENTLRSTACSAVNARKTHCKRGHPLAGTNLVIVKTGARQCRICTNLKTARYRARRRQCST